MPELRILLLSALLLLGACAGPNQQPTMADMDILAQDQDFALVKLGKGQDFDDLARVFLGHSGQSWQLREVNADHSARAGQLVAVPLRPVNSSSVYSNGYRTLPILCYHQFTSAGKASHQLELSAGMFEQQIRYLVNEGFVLLSFAQLNSILREGRPIPEKGVVITIDDGYRSFYDVAWPILQQYQVPATLFIYTDFIGAPAAMSWQQLRELAATGLIEIESHAKSHTSLSRQDSDSSAEAYQARISREISASNAIFRQQLGSAPAYLSYPYGDSSDAAAAIARDQGMLLAATVTRGDNPVYADPYLLHRSMVYDSHSMADFKKMLRVFREKTLQ